MMTTTGITNSVISNRLQSCFKVSEYYAFTPSSFYMMEKDGTHCELCHAEETIGQSVTISERQYDVCCAVAWAVDKLRYPRYRTN